MSEPHAFHSSIPLALSPNRHPRKAPAWLGTVLHFTASRGGVGGDIAWLCDPRSRVSAHFVISREGKTTQLVPLDDCAWHAGISELVLPGGKTLRGCNEFMLGIELDNLGPVVKDEAGQFHYESGGSLMPYHGLPPVRADLVWAGGLSFDAWWEPYPDVQIAALALLLGQLADAGHKDAVHALIGHEEVARPYGRKRDPGPAFPWARFARRLPRITSAIPDAR